MPRHVEGRPVGRPASWLAVAILAVGMLAVPSPAAAADPANGPLLYTAFPSYLKTIDGVETPLDIIEFGPKAFSPDGSKIATSTTTCADAACTEDVSTIRVHAADGTFTDLAPVSGFISDLTWSPDQTQVGAMTGIGSEAAIWRVPVDGGNPTLVLGSSSTFRIADEGIDWSPTGSSIAFVGTPTDTDGVSLAINTDQLYTVAATGGAPSKYSGQLAECEYPTCRLVSYSQPDWSPDGSKVAAYVVDETENFDADTRTIEEYLGLIEPGQLPTEVVRIQTLTNPTQWTYLQRQQPIWSTDGGQLLYARQGQDGTVARIVTPGGGVVATPTDGSYDDWQPCPTGTCVAWGEATTGADVRVKVTGYTDRARVGAAEPVVVTVVNRGPETATDIELSVATPGRSATQGWVRWRGLHEGWTCDTSDAERLTCSGPSLADEEAVKLELGVVPLDKAKASRLTASVTTTSSDPVLSNNTVTQQQRIRKLVTPKLPKTASGRVSARILRKWGWWKVNNKRNLWIAATNIVYKEPSQAEGLPGWYGATLWGYAPRTSVYRINFANRVCGPRGGICLGFLGHPASGGDCYFTRSNYCGFISGARVIFEGDKVQRATWKFFPGKVKGGLVIRTARAQKYTYNLPRG